MKKEKKNILTVAKLFKYFNYRVKDYKKHICMNYFLLKLTILKSNVYNLFN